MNDYEQRIKVLEEKVKILEETLETLRNMQMSEQMQGYIKAKTRTLKMAELINSISDKPELDMSKEQNAVKSIEAQKRILDHKIANSIENARNSMNRPETSPELFNYEIENGMITDVFGKKENNQCMTPYVGKGIRITSYNGFGSEDVLIPKEIEGKPVISIGEKAFMNATFASIDLPDTILFILSSAFEGCSNLSHIDLPDTILFILSSAFEGCSNLSHIDLPENLRFIGDYCFEKSGLTDIIFPDNLVEISRGCCRNCKELRKATIGNKTKKIESASFQGTAVFQIIIPENIEEISSRAFFNDYSTVENIECAFLGRKTKVKVDASLFDTFYNVKCIYCLPGSEIQKYAREHKIPIKPLSEFKSEE